jgi:hypothetical protein
VEYFHYWYSNREKEDVPDMDIPVELCLELLVAADYLGLDSEFLSSPLHVILHRPRLTCRRADLIRLIFERHDLGCCCFHVRRWWLRRNKVNGQDSPWRPSSCSRGNPGKHIQGGALHLALDNQEQPGRNTTSDAAFGAPPPS